LNMRDFIIIGVKVGVLITKESRYLVGNKLSLQIII